MCLIWVVEYFLKTEQKMEKEGNWFNVLDKIMNKYKKDGKAEGESQ